MFIASANILCKYFFSVGRVGVAKDIVFRLTILIVKRRFFQYVAEMRNTIKKKNVVLSSGMEDRWQPYIKMSKHFEELFSKH